MKAIVVYKSKTGFTKKYAQWIAEDLSAEIFQSKDVTIEKLADYDAVIYGGGLYAGGISGLKLITQNLSKLRGKKIAVFATGASTGNQEDIKNVTVRNFTPEQLETVKYFYMRGGFDYNKLGLFDKMLMNIMKSVLKSKKNPTPDERGMLGIFDKPVDFTKRENIEELVKYIKEDIKWKDLL